HGTGAAECNKREIAWIVATLDRQQADAAGHALIHHREDRLGGLLDAKTKPGAEIADRLARRLDVEAVALDPDRPRRIDAREYHVGGGPGRTRAAAAPPHRAPVR